MSQNRAENLNDTRDTHDTLVCQPIQHKTTCEVCRKNQKSQKIICPNIRRPQCGYRKFAASNQGENLQPLGVTKFSLRGSKKNVG